MTRRRRIWIGFAASLVFGTVLLAVLVRRVDPPPHLAQFHPIVVPFRYKTARSLEVSKETNLLIFIAESRKTEVLKALRDEMAPLGYSEANPIGAPGHVVGDGEVWLFGKGRTGTTDQEGVILVTGGQVATFRDPFESVTDHPPIHLPNEPMLLVVVHRQATAIERILHLLHVQ